MCSGVIGMFRQIDILSPSDCSVGIFILGGKLWNTPSTTPQLAAEPFRILHPAPAIAATRCGATSPLEEERPPRHCLSLYELRSLMHLT